MRFLGVVAGRAGPIRHATGGSRLGNIRFAVFEEAKYGWRRAEAGLTVPRRHPGGTARWWNTSGGRKAYGALLPVRIPPFGNYGEDVRKLGRLHYTEAARGRGTWFYLANSVDPLLVRRCFLSGCNEFPPVMTSVSSCG